MGVPMDYADPKQWSVVAEAVKTSIGAIGSAYDLIKKFRSSSSAPTPQEEQVIDQALITADTAAKMVHAEIAKALGYKLCLCSFPPTPMLTIGYQMNHAAKRTDPVFECATCGYKTSGAFSYQRIAPPRVLATQPLPGAGS